jgi:hypothetical protein
MKDRESTSFGNVTINFSWHIKFWLELWHFKEEILELQDKVLFS